MADLIANQRNQHSVAGSQLLGDGGDSARRRKQQQKQSLLDDFVSRSSSRAVENRGSSLFIRRVADLEDNNKAGGKDHFKDSSGQVIEMSQ